MLTFSLTPLFKRRLLASAIVALGGIVAYSQLLALHMSAFRGYCFFALSFSLSVFILSLMDLPGILWFSAAIFMGLSGPSFLSDASSPDLLEYYLFVSVALSFCVAAAGARRLVTFGLSLCFVLLFVIPESIVTGYSIITSSHIGAEQTNVIFETNQSEAFGYLQLHAREALPLVIYLAGLCCMIVLAVYLFRKRVAACPNKVTAFGMTVLFCLGTVSTSSAQSRLHDLFLIEMEEEHNAKSTAVAKETASHLDRIGSRLTDPSKAIYIVVVGESANRHHLSLYGYFRPTTPYLDHEGDGILVPFTNAISSYCMTTASLRRALTLATVDSGRQYGDSGMYSIVEILRGAGVNAFWISNQPEEGDLPAIISSSNQTFPMADGHQGYDEVMMGTVDSILKQASELNTPTVIFVHLVGSHYAYDARYPANLENKLADSDDAEAFGPRVRVADVNHYDNSIAYTDRVLHDLIARLKKQNVVTSLLYFSDHGESPYVGAGHDPGLFSIGHVEVPLVLWFSSQYADMFPGIVRSAKANVDGAFMLDRLSQLIMTWTHIQAPFYEPQRSLLTESFSATPRWTLDGRINYDALEDNYCVVTSKQTGFQVGDCKSAGVFSAK